MAPMALIGIIMLAVHFTELQCQSPVQFNENHAVIFFAPFYDPHAKTEPIKLEAVIKMVGVVATRFRKMIMIALRHTDYDTPKMLIPMAVAMYNRDYRNMSSSPVELFMYYKTDTDDDLTKHNSTVSEILLSTVLKLADEANSIFPASVTSIYYAAPGEDIDVVGRNLIAIERKIAHSPHSYELGIILSASYATTISWHIRQNKRPAISRLANVVLAFLLGDDTDSQYYNPTRIITKFEKMQASLQESQQQINNSNIMKVSLLTGYRGVVGNRDVTLVSVWQVFNNWTWNTNNTVVFHEAFDTVQKGSYKDRGWWRLVPNKTFSSADDYEFEEKQAVLRSSQSFEESFGEGSRVQMSNQAVFIGVALVVSLLVVTLIFVYFYKIIINRVSAATNVISEREVNHYLGECGVDADRLKKHGGKMSFGYDSFCVDELCIIGSANFGVVCSGEIVLNGVSQQVAVKMSKENGAKAQTLGVLNEIRILSYLGKHENIVELLGVHSENVLTGKVYTFLEFCPNGSLQSWLKRTNANLNQDCDQAAMVKQQKHKQLIPDLLQWSLNIANGMQFLASNKVVHADLAARSVLLGVQMKAVICDFGLSRCLDDNQGWMNTDNQELAWRWASPQVIGCPKVFNEKSDVWSYGVTLWEIFSLGELPFPDVSTKDELLAQLQNGRQLSEPLYSSENIYSAVIKKCLNYDPEARPNFQEVVAAVQKLNIAYDTVV